MARLQRVEDISLRGRSEKRARIVEAATRVFGRTGYHGARIADIAREAGIAYGLVYHYFKNKEEILGTIFQERWGAFLEVVERIAAEDATTRAKLERIAGLVLGAYRLHPDWVKVLVFEIQRSSRFAEEGQVRAVRRLIETVARVLQDGQTRGELRSDFDPDVASTLFLGGLESLITAVVLEVKRIDEPGGDEIFYPRAADTVVSVFFRGVSAAPQVAMGVAQRPGDESSRAAQGAAGVAQRPGGEWNRTVRDAAGTPQRAACERNGVSRR